MRSQRIIFMLKHFVLFCTMLTASTLAQAAPECRLNSDCAIDESCDKEICVTRSECAGSNPPCDCFADHAGCATGEFCLRDGSGYSCTTDGCVSDFDCPVSAICLSNKCSVDTTADRDQDGIPDGIPSSPRDNCPDDSNPNQRDNDFDSLGDVCDADDDNDGVLDISDNCQYIANPNQLDSDGDGDGDVCDEQPLCSSLFVSGVNSDGDQYDNACDKCEYLASDNNYDSDGDDIGDPCDPDLDGDNVRNDEDNCPGFPNSDQADCNCDGIGDACSLAPCDEAFCSTLN